jgi:hypothetical protein
MRHQSSKSYWAEPLLGHKQYVFYVPGIFFPLCIGDNARDDFPICVNASINATILYKNVSVPMRHTAHEALEHADRPHKVIDMVNGFEKSTFGIKNACANGMVLLVVLVFSTVSFADVNYDGCNSDGPELDWLRFSIGEKEDWSE